MRSGIGKGGTCVVVGIVMAAHPVSPGVIPATEVTELYIVSSAFKKADGKGQGPRKILPLRPSGRV